MQFMYPLFFWALLAIGIPILIHLFHFRRFKTIYFPSVRFLKEIKEETSNRNKLKNLLVLLSRILAIAALVIAFAQPYIPQDDELIKGRKAVSIFLDNSFSMNASGEDISLFNKARLDAIEIVEAYENDDAFQIITHDFDYFQQNWLSKEEIIERIEELDLTYDVKLLSWIHQRQLDAFEDSKTEKYISYWLSDFQESSSDVDNIPLDSLVDYHAIKLLSVKDANISIDSCWWVAPIPVKGQKGNLIVRLKNHDSQDVEDLTINLNYNQQNFPLAKVDIKGEMSLTDTLSFTLNQEGWSEASISVRDYPVRFDDEYWIAFEVSEKIPIAIISDSEPSVYTRSVFNSAPIFETEYFSSSQIDYSALGNYKLILMEGVKDLSTGLGAQLYDYLKAGGNLTLFPDKQMNKESYNKFLSRLGADLIDRSEEIEAEIGFLNEKEFVFQGVFDDVDKNRTYPVSNFRFLLNQRTSNKNRQILAFRDGRSFLDVYDIDDGHFYFSTVPLDPDASDLVNQGEIFVPMLYRMALSSSMKDKISYTIGQNESIRVQRQQSTSDHPLRILGKNEFIPGIRNIGSEIHLDLMNQVQEAGIYSIYLQDELIQKVAFNYDRRESALESLTENGLSEFLKGYGRIHDTSSTDGDLTESIIANEKGLVLWKWFLILALLFLAIEIILLRWMKI